MRGSEKFILKEQEPVQPVSPQIPSALTRIGQQAKGAYNIIANTRGWGNKAKAAGYLGKQAVGAGIEKAKELGSEGKEMVTSKWGSLTPEQQKMIKYGGGALAGGAGLYALYKLLRRGGNNTEAENKLNQIRSIVNR